MVARKTKVGVRAKKKRRGGNGHREKGQVRELVPMGEAGRLSQTTLAVVVFLFR
jgi:hypothetical protein